MDSRAKARSESSVLIEMMVCLPGAASLKISIHFCRCCGKISFHNLAISRRLFLGEREEGDEKPDPSVVRRPPRRPLASRPPPLPRRDLTLLTSVLTAFDLTTLQTPPPRRSIHRKEGCSTKVYQVRLAKDKDKSAAIAV